MSPLNREPTKQNGRDRETQGTKTVVCTFWCEVSVYYINVSFFIFLVKKKTMWTFYENVNSSVELSSVSAEVKRGKAGGAVGGLSYPAPLS